MHIKKKKQKKVMINHFTEEESTIVNKHINGYSTSVKGNINQCHNKI